jgi:hypothetical protein
LLTPPRRDCFVVPPPLAGDSSQRQVGNGRAVLKRLGWQGCSTLSEEDVPMSRAIRPVAVLVISLCFFVCAGNGGRLAEADLAGRIVGEWEWVESFGGFAGEHRTPESVGYTKTYVFRADRTFLQYRDDTLFSTREYKITEKVVWEKEKAKVLEVEGMTDQIIGFEGNDTLRLAGHCIDCFSEGFVRIGSE